MNTRLALNVVATTVAVASTASIAQVSLFNFETTPATYPPGNPGGSLANLILTSQGLTATITRQGGLGFDVVDNNAPGQTGKPLSWGVRSLSPFFNEASPAPFIVNFSQSIVSASIEFGDYGADIDNAVFLRAFSGPNGTGTQIDFDSVDYLGTFPAIETMKVTGQGIQSLTFVAGSGAFPHSVFWDNLTVVVPSPASMSMLAISGMVAMRRRRERNTRS
jgi:hypothetical protein